MAILNKIRQRSLFLILVIALALFSFILADLFKNNNGFSSKSQNVVATVNGKDISRQDFMTKVENAQRQYGNSRTSTQVMNMVYDQELRKAILQTQYENLGLSVERDQMRDLLKQNLSSYEEFKNEAGVFDENKLNDFIASLKEFPNEVSNLGNTPINYAAWTNYENNIAQSGKEKSYFNMVKAGINATLTDGEFEYKLENDNVNIKYVQIPFSTIVDSTLEVSKSDIKNYINKNKSQYEVEASRDIAFVQFKEVPSAEDEKNIEEELTKLLEDKEEFDDVTKQTVKKLGFKNATNMTEFLAENSSIQFDDNFVFTKSLPAVAVNEISALNIGETFGPYKDGNVYKITKMVAEKMLPDSVKVRHILIPFAGAASAEATVTRTKEEAKKTADSVLAIVKRNPSKFGDLVTKLSSDKGSVDKGGEYDYHPYNTMVKPFNDFTFEGEKGDLGVVETVFGFHIIEVLGQTDAVKAVKVAHLAREIEPSEETIDQVFNTTSKFEIAVADADFNQVAKDNNYILMPVNSIKVLDENIPGLGAQRQMIRWAFDEDSNVGDVKRFTIPNGGFVVAQLQAKNAEGVMSTEKASVTALPAIRKEKKAKMIMDRISGATLNDIAAAEGQTVKTAVALNMKTPTLSGAGREPKVIGAAFGLKEGETSKGIIGTNGVYFVQVTKVTPAGEMPNYKANANRLTSTKTGNVSRLLVDALKEAAEVEDNRATFY
ncbi:MAG: SurA N-terminal domain-containing protein [Flavobacteriaceae bacterium]|nr:SurA N-terminal domain-containing protein [Flavobacteriaceae bacterium]